MLSLFSRSNPSKVPAAETVATLNDVATSDVVLKGLRDNSVVDARFHEFNRAVWDGLSKRYFLQAAPSTIDPLVFFNAQQNTLNLTPLTLKPGDEVLARKQLAIGLLLTSFAARKPDLPFADILKGIATGPALSLEKEALQTAVAATLEFDPDKAGHHTDLNVVLTTYLGREQQVHELFSQMLAQMGAKLKGWGLEMAALNSYYSLAQFFITCDAQLVRDAAGKVTAEVALRGNVRMVELLYPHIRQCACDVDPKYCVLEQAALARQREVLAFLLTTYAVDFPPDVRAKLLQNMAQQGKSEIVTYLLTEFRHDFSTMQILSLRGTPGFDGSQTSYWQLFGAPALQSVGGAFSGLWGSKAAMQEPSGALIPAAVASASADASFLALPSAVQTDESKNDGADNNGKRKKLAIEGPTAGSVSKAPPTFTPAAAAAASAASVSPVSPPRAEPAAGALVPFNKKRPNG